MTKKAASPFWNFGSGIEMRGSATERVLRHETPTFAMYGLSNPPMAREGDLRLDHWYEANLSIETHVLKLLAN